MTDTAAIKPGKNVVGIFSGQGDYRYVGFDGLDLASEFPSVHLRHVDIRQYKIKTIFGFQNA